MGIENKIIGLSIDWLQRLAQKAMGDRKVDYKEITDILDQDPDGLMKLYVEPDFQAYNPANATEDEPDDVESVFRVPANKWLNGFLVKPKMKDGRHVAFVLSDAGMGKTSLLVMLKATSLYSFWPDMKFKLLRLGSETLEGIKSCSDTVNTVLLLDSLDEDPEAFGRIEERLRELLMATTGFRQVVITCRTQFFPLQNAFEFNGARIKIGGFTCRLAYLSLFSEFQIDQYLTNLYSREGEEKEKAKNLIISMRSLRMRPMLLAHVEDLLEVQGSVRAWTPYTTHEALISAWVDREQRKGLSVGADQLRDACRVMAVQLQRSGERTIDADSLASLLVREKVPDAIMNVKDFGGRSLLNLNSDGEYRFAHYSIQEFLVADYMARCPEKMAQYSGDIRYSDELVNFLRSFTRIRPANWMANFSWAFFGGANLSGANFTKTVFRGANLQGADFSEADLSGADFTEADLRGTRFGQANLRRASLGKVDFRRANLNAADLSRAKLLQANLAGAKLIETDLSGGDLRLTNLTNADASRADLSDALLREASLVATTLSKANFRQADLREADLREANLTGADFTGADLRGANLMFSEENVDAEPKLFDTKGDKFTLIAEERRPQHWPAQAQAAERINWQKNLPKGHPQRYLQRSIYGR